MSIARSTTRTWLFVVMYLQIEPFSAVSSLLQGCAIQSSADDRTSARDASFSATISASWNCIPAICAKGRSSSGGLRSLR